MRPNSGQDFIYTLYLQQRQIRKETIRKRGCLFHENSGFLGVRSSVLNPFPLSVSRDFDPVQKLPPVIIPVYDSETDDSDENGAGDEDDNNDDSDDEIEF